MSRRSFLNMLFVLGTPLVAMMGGCGQKETAMRNEIIAYEKSVRGHSGQIDVTHLVEKYIKMGDSMETAKEILLKNGFSVYEYSVEEVKNRRDVRITCRIQAEYKIRGGLLHRVDIVIFLGNSPESEIVDYMLAKVNHQP